VTWFIRHWWTGCLIGLAIGMLGGWFAGGMTRQRFRRHHVPHLQPALDATPPAGTEWARAREREEARGAPRGTDGPYRAAGRGGYLTDAQMWAMA